MSINYNKPAIPKGTCGKFTPRVFYLVGFQQITGFFGFCVGRFSVVFRPFQGLKRVHLGAFRYMFQQIFSKCYG